MPYAELADGRLWTQTEGVGDDVLLIAGLADDASSWDAQVASLSTRFRVTVFDNGGRGGRRPRRTRPRRSATSRSTHSRSSMGCRSIAHT